MKNTRSSWWWTTRNKRKKYKKQTAQQTKGSQETKLREDKNSEREEQSVKPQQRDHSKKLRWHKTFNSSNVFCLSSKGSTISFQPHNPH